MGGDDDGSLVEQAPPNQQQCSRQQIGDRPGRKSRHETGERIEEANHRGVELLQDGCGLDERRRRSRRYGVVDLGDVGDELVFEDGDFGGEAGMATEEISDVDTIIEDDVFLGPSCVLTNVSNPRSQINRQALYETTVLRRGATVGAIALSSA